MKSIKFLKTTTILLIMAILLSLSCSVLAYSTNDNGDMTTISMESGEKTFQTEVVLDLGETMVASAQFDVVICDSKAIDLDGIEFNKEIKNTSSGTVSTIDAGKPEGEGIRFQAGFFSTDNQYKGKINVCTLKFKYIDGYSGDSDQTIVLNNLLTASFTGKAPNGIPETKSNNIELSKTITVKRKSNSDKPKDPETTNPTSNDQGSSNPGGSQGNQNPGNTNSDINKGGNSSNASEDDVVSKEDEPVPLSEAVILSDISGHFAEAYIKEAVKLGYISGYPDKTFRPNNYVSRADFAKMVVMAFGFTSKEGKNFIDTKNHYALQYISAAADNNLILGINKAGVIYFMPNESVTREQAATILYRTATQLKIELPQTNKPVVFADQKKISPFAVEAVAAMQKAGMIKGLQKKDAMYYDPQGKTTRAQAVVMIQGLLALKN